MWILMNFFSFDGTFPWYRKVFPQTTQNFFFKCCYYIQNIILDTFSVSFVILPYIMIQILYQFSIFYPLNNFSKKSFCDTRFVPKFTQTDTRIRTQSTGSSALEQLSKWREPRLQNDTVCCELLVEPWFFTSQEYTLLAT